jgi:DNA-binding MarR family transcriptional regulator
MIVLVAKKSREKLLIFYSSSIFIVCLFLPLPEDPPTDESVQKLDLKAKQGRIIGYIYEHQDKGVIQKDLAETFNRRGASITSSLQGLKKKDILNERFQQKMNARKIFMFYQKAKL